MQRKRYVSCVRGRESVCARERQRAMMRGEREIDACRRWERVWNERHWNDEMLE